MPRKKSEPHQVSEPQNCHESVADAVSPLVRVYGKGAVAFAMQGVLHTWDKDDAKKKGNASDGSCKPQVESAYKYDPMNPEPTLDAKSTTPLLDSRRADKPNGAARVKK